MGLKEYFRLLRRWWWLLLLTTALGILSSYFTLRSTPPVYRSSTTLMVGMVIQNPNPDWQEFVTGERLAQTYAEIVTRRPILEKVVEALGLECDWRSLRGKVKVQAIPKTQLLEISVTDSSPERARDIANEIAHQLILQSPTIAQDELEVNRREFVKAQLNDLQRRIEKGQGEIANLEASLSQVFDARQMEEIQEQIATLQKQITSWQSSYAQLLNSLQTHRPVNYLTVIEPAQLPTAPARPNAQRSILFAGAIGLILGAGVALLLEYLDDTIKSPEQVKDVLKLPLLGAIARAPNRDHCLVTAHHPRSPISEAYRLLRANIQFTSPDKPLKSILVTSPGPEEGKSFILANLGVVMASAGLKTILVDSDLRKPTLHKIFNISNKEGLTNLLVETKLKLESCLQSTEVEGLFVLPSGPLPPNPTELLGSNRMATLIEALEEDADVILYDSPPALIVADASVLATRMDGVLLVTWYGHTRREAALQAKELLLKTGANILGVVINRFSSDGAGYYYYSYYYYYGKDKQFDKLQWLRRIFK